MSQFYPGFPQPMQPIYQQPLVSKSTVPVAAPVVQSRALQDRYPGLKARLAQLEQPFQRISPDFQASWRNLQQVRRHEVVDDFGLGRMDDQAKRLGSLLIAGLATYGLKQRTFGVGEFLGFLTWYTGMALTPKVINGMVRLKTGVNLGQLYYDSNGKLQNLYRDPGYLPLHILPDPLVNRIGDKLGIPPGPDRRRQVEERMRRVSIQSGTWWMLVAGPATPIISGLLCDALQSPATRLINRVKTAWAGRGLSSAEGDNLVRKSERYLAQTLGEVPESKLSLWWKQFGAGMIHQTGLGKALSVKEATGLQREQLVRRMVDQMAELGDKPAVQETLAYLQGQGEQVDAIERQAQEMLERVKERLDGKTWSRLKEQADYRIGNAKSTLHHYTELFKALGQGVREPSRLRELMEDNIITVVRQLRADGHYDEAVRMAGGPEQFRRISKLIDVRQARPAEVLLGAAPQDHLLSALKDVMLRKRWQRRIGGFGGAILLATVLYTTLWVGRTFNDKPKEGKKP